ncbi:TraR/DksA family transcriptional regulator [Piscinibacter koreensis]|uniref:TraR/DksA family transcriptional regulator n=1 Tax=Piscinibacter koreensis TaxID=2742824 RepID=A0A7Y6TVY7_9BURK|nr:TraR/DksA family transcriptional regulator [Schlegelella koreensis]NUZ05525.1 TraR/DksA family transcriptional regulator [Schlegelella koreensis]
MPLHDEQIQRLRARLEQRASELRDELDASKEADASETQQPHNQVEDLAERGEQITREIVTDGERERDFRELREVQLALGRISAGGYGICVDCGVDIPTARLEAQPWAARCIECQTRFEAEGGQPPLGAPG